MIIKYLLILISFSFVCHGQTTNGDGILNINYKDIIEIEGFVYLKTDTTLVTGNVTRYNKKNEAKKYIIVVNGIPDKSGWINLNDYKYVEPKESAFGSLVTTTAVVTDVVMAVSGNDINVPFPNYDNKITTENTINNYISEQKNYASKAYNDMSERNEISLNLISEKELNIGHFEEYYEDGQLEIKGNYIDGKKDGLWEEYRENGQLRSKIVYNKGVKDGLWEQYHSNSQLWSKGHYKDGRMIGEWNYYDEIGELLLTENYDN